MCYEKLNILPIIRFSTVIWSGPTLCIQYTYYAGEQEAGQAKIEVAVEAEVDFLYRVYHVLTIHIKRSRKLYFTSLPCSNLLFFFADEVGGRTKLLYLPFGLNTGNLFKACLLRV